MKISDAYSHVLKTALGEATKYLVVPALAALGAGFSGRARFIRVMSVEEWLLWASSIALASLVAVDLLRRWRSAKAAQDDSDSSDRDDAPYAEIYTSTARDKVPVGDWMPAIRTVEHAGVVWTTLMSPVPDWAMGRSYKTPVDDISVAQTPTCKQCSTDIMIRRQHARSDYELYCVGCDWTQPVTQSLARLAAEATAKVRGVYRQLLVQRETR